MGEEIITRVHILAEKEGRSKVINNFNFEWRPGTVINELHAEEINEDSQLTSEIVEENEDPDVEQMQQSKERIEDNGPITHEEEDQSEEPFDPLQSTDKGSISQEDMEPDKSEPGEESETKLDKEEHDEEDNLKDSPPTPNDEDELHSSGYKLRKREPINYGKARRYKTKAAVSYQYGEVSKVNDQILKTLDEEKVLIGFFNPLSLPLVIATYFLWSFQNIISWLPI